MAAAAAAASTGWWMHRLLRSKLKCVVSQLNAAGVFEVLAKLMAARAELGLPDGMSLGEFAWMPDAARAAGSAEKETMTVVATGIADSVTRKMSAILPGLTAARPGKKTVHPEGASMIEIQIKVGGWVDRCRSNCSTHRAHHRRRCRSKCSRHFAHHHTVAAAATGRHRCRRCRPSNQPLNQSSPSPPSSLRSVSTPTTSGLVGLPPVIRMSSQPISSSC